MTTIPVGRRFPWVDQLLFSVYNISTQKKPPKTEENMKGRKRIIALLSAVLLLAGLVSGAGGSYEWCDECDGYSATELRNASENYTGDLYCSGCGRLIQKGQTIDLNEETQPEDPPAGNGEQAEETEKPQESTEPGEPTNETNPPEAETPNQPPAEAE